MSDDAPQFKLFGLIDGRCWVHGERKIDRLIPLTASHRHAKEQSQQQFWDLYASLQDCRKLPREEQCIEIGLRFDAMCSQKTGYVELNEANVWLNYPAALKHIANPSTRIGIDIK